MAEDGNMFEEEAIICHDKTEKQVDKFLDEFEEKLKPISK
jgi:hypothetical protein